MRSRFAQPAFPDRATLPCSSSAATGRVPSSIWRSLAKPRDGKILDLTRKAVFESSSPRVAAVDPQAVVHGNGDGSCTITARVGGLLTEHFGPGGKRNSRSAGQLLREIVPVLTKAGCNQGACHGGMHGRGGFRLSLLGFDPAFDYDQIVQSAEGRRVVVSDPERSILLLKPTLTMEHGGGERFRAHGREYALIQQWLEDGAPPPAAADPEVVRLEAWPTQCVMEPGQQRQILTCAIWSDGREADVTAIARYDALNDSVASVDTSGLVTVRAKGETSIMVRFAGQVAVAQVTLPFKSLPPYPELPISNFIDEKLIAKWKALGLTPSPAVFRRRVLPCAAPGRDRLFARARGHTGLSFGSDARQAGQSRRPSSRPTGVRRFLDSKMGRPSANQPRGSPG